MDKYKTVQEKKELYIQFTEEEMREMGWEENQKLSFSYDKDTNSILLKPYVKVNIDMSDWPRQTLEFLIDESCRRDVSCNQVIEDVLKEHLNTPGISSKKEELLCE